MTKTVKKSLAPISGGSLKTPLVIKNSDKYVSVHIDKNKRTKGIFGSPSFLRLQSESEFPEVEEDMVTIDTSKCRSNIDVVRKCIKDLGWREFPYGRRDNNCDIFWNAINFNETPDLQSGKVSKFPGTLEIFSKSNLFRCLDVMKSLYPNDYTFYPKTWFLPHQFYHFNSVVKNMIDRKVKPKPTFIVKPSDGSQGEGIYLLRDPSQYSHQGHKKHIVQEYLTNILTIDNFKFDFRIYAVVKNIDPLEIHICKEGLARFSTIPYENPNAKNLHESFMHLTNYSLNKRSSTFDKSEKENEGSKRKLSQVLNLLKSRGHDSEKVWLEIEQIVCKTILAVIGDLKVEFQSAAPPGKTGPSCFQIFGFDILLLKDLKPMLLEVNSNPSLRIDCEQEVSPGVMQYVLSLKDEDVKRPLIRDTLMLVGPHSKYTRKRRRKKTPKPPVIKREITNQPTALVIKSETQEISERLLKFGLNDHPYNPSNTIGDDENNSNYQDISHLERANQTLTSISTNRSREQSQITNASYNENQSNTVTNQNTKRNSESTNENSDSVYSNEGDGINSDCDADEDTEQSDSCNTSTHNSQEKTDADMNIAKEEDSDSEEKEKLVDNIDREESCLKEIYPCPYASDYHHLHIMEKMSTMFMSCTGVRGSTRLSSSGFRLFTRKCKLNGKGISNATIDLVYIDVQRKWEHMSHEKGLNFCGFVDACQDLAKRKFTSSDKLEMLETFIEFCEENMEAFNTKQTQEEEEKEKKTLLTRRPQAQRSLLYPQFTSANLGEATLHDLYGQSLRKEYINLQHKKVNAFMQAHHKLRYKHRTCLEIKSKYDDP